MDIHFPFLTSRVDTFAEISFFTFFTFWQGIRTYHNKDNFFGILHAMLCDHLCTSLVFSKSNVTFASGRITVTGNKFSTTLTYCVCLCRALHFNITPWIYNDKNISLLKAGWDLKSNHFLWKVMFEHKKDKQTKWNVLWTSLKKVLALLNS